MLEDICLCFGTQVFSFLQKTRGETLSISMRHVGSHDEKCGFSIKENRWPACALHADRSVTMASRPKTSPRQKAPETWLPCPGALLLLRSLYPF